jgi:membrane-associated phospholipid phosphatase
MLSSKILFVALILSLQNFAQSPYSFDLDNEAILYGTGISLGILENELLKQREQITIEELRNISRDNLNSFDKIATYNWSPNANAISDVLLVITIASPLFLLTSSDVHNDIGAYTNMYFQNAIFSYSLAYLAKSTFYRLRPYAYNPDVPTDEKLTKGTTLSFFSGHSTMAFSSAIFLSTMFQKYFPDSKLIPYIWGTSLVFASIVGYLRVYSGQHFPSDVITGAVVGSLVGYIIPLIHENQENKSKTLPLKIQTNNVFSFKINF